jgi:hypothetical protein
MSAGWPGTDPYAGMSDEQVLARAARALGKVPALPLGSVERAIQWAVYESAKAELDRRMFLHLAAALGQQQ